MENGKCHFCGEHATTTRECDDGKTHPICVGCANAWYDNEYHYVPYIGPRDVTDAHMERYITNRNERTGQTWRVVERYATNGNGTRVTSDDQQRWYERAVIANEHDERARIWYRVGNWEIA